VHPVSAVGEDEAGDKLAQHFNAMKVDTSGLVRVSRWQTPTKIRFLAGWPHTVHQQVLRLDREPSEALPARALDGLVRRARERLGTASAMLVSDYGYGTGSPEMVQRVRGRRSWRLAVTLDSRYRLHNYRRLGITAATPNEAELEAAHHVQINDAAQLEKAARQTLAHLGMRALVVTRGRHGMTVFERGCGTQSLAVFGSDQAVDVTGAGDTVIATFTLALAAGARVLEAAQLANYAGGIVVMKRGTATVTREELLNAIRAEVTGEAPAQK
jgi:rfaE bifunctional protein kinase chain/domain